MLPSIQSVFQFSLDRMFLSVSDFKSDLWGDCQMASYFQKFEMHVHSQRWGCEWECARVLIKLQHHCRISEQEGTPATILPWYV